ncbi:MAG: hypothetical protein HYY40_03960 [Bacteroidetes bacterium]|nr:hypothetical protein [Bacteroidota bacterium]
MSVITEYPLWFIVFCLLTGLLYSALLYYKNRNSSVINRYVVYLLSGIRFLAVSFLAFLLLNPLIRKIYREVEKPLIVFAQDNSISVSRSADSLFVTGEYRDRVKKFLNDMQDDYDTDILSFGEEVSGGLPFTFNGRQTDISELFTTLNELYRGRNLGAIILSSDGIYNRGNNPLHLPLKISAPVFTIILGDTARYPDIYFSKINYNKVAYLGNEFPVEIIVNAWQCRGKKTMLAVENKNKDIMSRDLLFSGSNQSQVISFRLKAGEPGVQKYRMKLTPVEGEASPENNYTDIFINVLDSRQKILLLAAAPHPDITAIRQSVESNLNYETDFFLIKNYDRNPAGYHLVILHQVPVAGGSGQTVIKEIIKNHIPALFIIGNRTSIPEFNLLNTGVTVIGGGNKSVESLPVLNGSFDLFAAPEGFMTDLSRFPPLLCPIGTYNTDAGTNVLFYQKTGAVTTSYPMIIFRNISEQRIGVITGEGLWKWRLYDFSMNGNHNRFNEFTNKIIQYLSVRSDKSNFRIIAKNLFFENEPVLFSAEVYNESYELVNQLDVNITVINSEGKKFPFTFSRTSEGYFLNAGYFPPGDYRYEARTALGGKPRYHNGKFVISPLMVESARGVADYNLLFSLAAKYGGELISPAAINELPAKIRNRTDIKPVSFMHKEMKEMINIKWISLLIIALLSVEWFIRKWSGGY